MPETFRPMLTVRGKRLACSRRPDHWTGQSSNRDGSDRALPLRHLAAVLLLTDSVHDPITQSTIFSNHFLLRINLTSSRRRESDFEAIARGRFAAARQNLRR